ncbi:MKRN2 opposite strand protein [Anabrus simplex]|uniref:MKRN2 opposite strand protein n=1 Tax=Anabrus simplex TaxID=316456 RepID=UPI0034DD1898
MDTDPGILCFQHCGSKVFCYKLLENCPVCGDSLAAADFQLPPFRVPYPFVRAAQHPCCIVIKPTTGDFLNDYLNSMDLHIGVTTSAGVVVEFDKDGLQKDRTCQWRQCLVVDGAAGPWSDHWDSTLEDVAQQKCWSSLSYNEDSFNCYTFVLTFLRNLDYGNLSKAASSRTTFCENFIVPRTTAAGKYISLYRKLCVTGCYIHKAEHIQRFPNY